MVICDKIELASSVADSISFPNFTKLAQLEMVNDDGKDTVLCRDKNKSHSFLSCFYCKHQDILV